MSRSQSLACSAVALFIALLALLAVTGILSPQTATAALVSVPAEPDPPHLLAVWPEQDFRYPYGVAVDSYGNIYVSDPGNNRIQRFTPDGAFLAEWGSMGSGEGQFDEPRGVAVDSCGSVFVADTLNNRIQEFTLNGAFLQTWGTEGLDRGEFANPHGVTVDGSGRLYVADTDNKRIQKFGYLTATGAVQRLHQLLLSLPLTPNAVTRLEAKLDVEKLLADLNTANDKAALNRLRAFTNSVKAQAGKQIKGPDANYLIACAQTAGNVVKEGMLNGAQLTAQDAALYDDELLFLPAVAR